jgi:phosphohistidine phosphatase SixA
VLLVGHNPGLEELVRDLTGEPIALPTAALAALDCECEAWSDLRAPAPRARLAGFWKPKEL